MRRWLALAAAVLALSWAAHALAAPNPTALVAQAESSGCQNTSTPSSTASGCFGFTNGTWARYAPQAGVSLTQCPTAASCPVSSQFAVFAADVNSRGLSDWTCPGCDSTVSNAVNSGQLPASGYNLSTNPADYASLDTPSGLQAYFASNGTTLASNSTPGLTVTPMAPATAAANGFPTSGSTGTAIVGGTPILQGNVLDGVVQNFEQQAQSAQSAFYNAGLDLFGWLALISFAVAFIMMFIRSGFKLWLEDVAAECFRQIFSLGLVYWLLTYSQTIGNVIVSGFQQIAQNAGAPALTPSNVIGAALNIIGVFWQGMGWHFGADAAIAIFAVVTIIAFAWIAAEMVIVLVESYFAVAGAALYISLGALELNREAAIGFVRYLVSVGAKLMTLEILAGVGLNMMKQWSQAAQGGASISWSGLAIILCCAVVLAILVHRLPTLFQNLILGTATSAFSHAHARGAANTVAAGTVGAFAASTGSFAVAVQAFKTAISEMNAAKEDGNASGGLAGQAVMMAGSIGKSVANAGLSELGYRTGGRGWSMAGRIAGQRRVAEAARTAPTPPNQSGNP